MVKLSKCAKKNILVILFSFFISFSLVFHSFATLRSTNSIDNVDISSLSTSTDYVSGLGNVTYYDLSSYSDYNYLLYRPAPYSSGYYYSDSFSSSLYSGSYGNSYGIVWGSNYNLQGINFYYSSSSFGTDNTSNLRFQLKVTLTVNNLSSVPLDVPISYSILPTTINSSMISAPQILSYNSSSRVFSTSSSVSILFSDLHTFTTGETSYTFTWDSPLIFYSDMLSCLFFVIPLNTYNTSSSFVLSCDDVQFLIYNSSGSGDSGSGSFDDSNIVQGLDNVQQGINALENTLTNGQTIDLENDDVLPSQSYEDAEDNIDVAGQDLASFLDYITAALNWFPQMWNSLLDDSGGFNPFFLLTPAAGFLILRSLLGR